MFDVDLFLKFKEVIESIFGEDFYDIRLIKDNFPNDQFRMFKKEWEKWIQGFFSMKKRELIPHDSYFSCILTPINPPSGTSFLIVVSKKDETYRYVGAGSHLHALLLYKKESSSLRGLIFDYASPDLFEEELAFLESAPQRVTQTQTNTLTLEEWDFIHEFNGYMRREKNYPETIERLKEIGDRFPKRNIPYLYRGIGNGLFHEEIASSFETSCTEEKETVLFKDLNDMSKKYLQYYIRGLSSWSIHKHKTTPYLNQARHRIGGGILMVWANPKPQEIILDTDPIYEYAEGKFPKQSDPLNGGEVLAKPANPKIIGIKRFLNTQRTCDYIVILRS